MKSAPCLRPQSHTPGPLSRCLLCVVSFCVSAECDWSVDPFIRTSSPISFRHTLFCFLLSSLLSFIPSPTFLLSNSSPSQLGIATPIAILICRSQYNGSTFCYPGIHPLTPDTWSRLTCVDEHRPCQWRRTNPRSTRNHERRRTSSSWLAPWILGLLL